MSLRGGTQREQSKGWVGEERMVETSELLYCVMENQCDKTFFFHWLGIKAVAECLAKSNSEETQDCARSLLQQLSNVSTSRLDLIPINECKMYL